MKYKLTITGVEDARLSALLAAITDAGAQIEGPIEPIGNGRASPTKNKSKKRPVYDPDSIAGKLKRELFDTRNKGDRFSPEDIREVSERLDINPSTASAQVSTKLQPDGYVRNVSRGIWEIC